MKKYIKSSNAIGEPPVTIMWGDNLCAVYKEQYNYGGTAILMWDMTDGEFWGDVSINLPAYSLEPNEIFLQGFIDSKGIKYLSPILKVTGEVKNNYGRYKMAEIKPAVFDKIPTWAELEPLL